jgi:hypothetical protein
MKILKYILGSLVTLGLLVLTFWISVEVKESKYKNYERFGKIWSPYGAVNTEIYLLTNNTFFSNLMGSVYYGTYSIKGDIIYLWSDDLSKLDVCNYYKILGSSNHSHRLEPSGDCLSKTMYFVLYERNLIIK